MRVTIRILGHSRCFLFEDPTLITDVVRVRLKAPSTFLIDQSFDGNSAPENRDSKFGAPHSSLLNQRLLKSGFIIVLSWSSS